jgi:AraC family transcriptional regulator
MNKLEIDIVTLKPMRIISAYGFGPEPEGIAAQKITAFGIKHELFTPSEPQGTFGFNNPDPSPGSPNYGYEIWLPVGPEIEPEDDLRVIKFSGGLYAVTNFTGLSKIGPVWGELVKWREASKYRHGNHQWLEELLVSPDTPLDEYEFNLYIPISE